MIRCRGCFNAAAAWDHVELVAVSVLDGRREARQLALAMDYAMRLDVHPAPSYGRHRQGIRQ